MVDLILFLFVVGVFSCGFWVGKTFGSMKAATSRASVWFVSLFK